MSALRAIIFFAGISIAANANAQVSSRLQAQLDTLSSPLAKRLHAIRGIGCQPAEGGDICVFRSPNTMAPRFNYSQQIAMLIPKGISRPSDLLLHLHGHRGFCEPHSANALQMVKTFGMDKQLFTSNAKNSVMIFPVSTGNETTFNAELVPQFKTFTKWINDVLQPMPSHKWTMSGHSGAYLPIGNILASQSNSNPDFIRRLNSVIMLDATYTTKSYHFNSWRKALRVNPDLQAFSIYKGGTDTQAGSLEMRRVLPRGQIELEVDSQTRHCQIPNLFYKKYLHKTLENRIQEQPADSRPRRSTRPIASKSQFETYSRI